MLMDIQIYHGSLKSEGHSVEPLKQNYKIVEVLSINHSCAAEFNADDYPYTTFVL